ncbi:MAG: AMP-binding protein, partial [bacterium]
MLKERELTVSDVIDKNAILRSDDVAIVCEDVQWSFGRYVEEVDRLAGSLVSLGIGKQERIAVVAFNCPEYFQIYGAAAKIGAIVVPINWRFKKEEIQFILEDSSPELLIADQEFIETLGNVADKCSIKHRLVIGQKIGEFSPIDEVSSIDANLGFVGVEEEDPLVIIYTAAVEGRPRGAIITHGNLIAANLQAIATLGIESSSTYLNLAPLYHIGGLVMSLSVMHAGGRNVIIKRFEPKYAADLIKREKVTIIETFPPM